MSRPKMGKSTPHIDMTAMCDVAFLLLSFFILATKLKPEEAVPVSTPSTVSTVPAPKKDIVQVTLNKDGKVFLAIQDKDKKQEVLDQINANEKLGLSETEIQNLVKQDMIAVPFAQLKQQANLANKAITASMPGIPVSSDSTGKNELTTWMASVNDVYLGKNMNLILNGDNVAKYPSFKGVVNAFTTNEQFKFSMVTNPESIPQGTLLWNANQAKSQQ